MSNHLNAVSVWLVGPGVMAQDYCKVLQALPVSFKVIGRGTGSAAAFQERTGVLPFVGGLQAFLATSPELPDAAIVAVTVDQLAEVTRRLLDAGVCRILLEKPAGIDGNEINALCDYQRSRFPESQIVLGYNRRFYGSTLKAQEMIKEDGGVTSVHFEFTEWSHVIEGLDLSPEIKRNWFIANSSHVADLAFFLGGRPRRIEAFVAGALGWHPDAAVFAGAGVTETGALFSYHANWAAPGRWGVEVLTRKRRLIFRPMEQLQVQQIGSVEIKKVDLEGDLDSTFKPGLMREVQAFLSEQESPALLALAEHAKLVSEVYSRMLVPALSPAVIG